MLAKLKTLLKDVKIRAQAVRFGRLFVVALAATGIVDQVLAGGVSRTAVISAVVGAAEVAFRQFVPPKVGTPVGVVTVQSLVGTTEAIAKQLIAQLTHSGHLVTTQPSNTVAPATVVTPPSVPAPPGVPGVTQTPLG